VADSSIHRSFMPDDTLARIGDHIATAITMHTAFKYLLRTWDPTDGPAAMNAHLGTLEACVERSKVALQRASDLLPDRSPGHLQVLLPFRD